jgi:CCR4-NOT transcriptional regulation complex NOT5 subunit
VAGCGPLEEETMCRTNPVTKDHIEQMKSSLLRRMSNPNLTPEQRAKLQEQYDYVVENVKEREGSEPPPGPFIIGV